MAVSLNEVIIGGNLTADIELRQTTSGISVIKFSLAVHRKGTKGEEQKTDFFKVTAWRQSAEFLSRYAKKGDCVVVVGKLKTESWKDQHNQNRIDTFIEATEVQLDKLKPAGAQDSYAEDGFGGEGDTPF